MYRKDKNEQESISLKYKAQPFCLAERKLCKLGINKCLLKIQSNYKMLSVLLQK